MPQTRQNKTTVPINGDAYNLCGDLAFFADTANVIIPVASQTERDALTKKVGLAVTRQDLNQLVEVCDGTNWWSTAKVRRATYTATGSGSGSVGAGTPWGLSALTVVAANTFNNPTQAATIGSNGAIQFNEVGDYTIDMKLACSADPGTLYGKITDSGGSNVYADNWEAAGTNHPWGVTVPKGSIYIPTAGTQLLFGFTASIGIAVTAITATIDVRKNQG